MFNLDPIGYFHTHSKAPYDVPRQPLLQTKNQGRIQLKKGYNFEQALEGLEGFDRIWVIFRFHRHHHWKPKVLPSRGGKKQGVFATRSPHRPNFIGISCVKLMSIQGLNLFITYHDLIDQTPILDLKPYLDYADSFTSGCQGWLDKLAPEVVFSIYWSDLAQAQISYLNRYECHLQEAIEHRLSQSPLPYANNRVKQIKEEEYELAYQTWRIEYQCKEETIMIHHIRSGYDLDTLKGAKPSKWKDVPLHQSFMSHFEKANSG